MILNVLEYIINSSSLFIQMRYLEKATIVLPMWPILVAQLIDYLGSKSNLNSLYRIKYKQPQLAIKLIKIVNIIPCGPRDELI